MMVIQFVLVIFFLFALFKVVNKFRASELKAWDAIGWAFFWIFAGVVILKPDTTYVLAGILGVGRGVDAIIYLTVAILFFLVFRIFIRLEKIERNLTKLTRQDSLKNVKK